MSEYQSFEDSLAGRRAEDKAKSEQGRKDQEMARAKHDAERRYTNPVRREEAQTRFKELLAPAQAPSRPKSSPAAPASGTPVEFYVYQDGVIGKIKILTEGSFTPL